MNSVFNDYKNRILKALSITYIIAIFQIAIFIAEKQTNKYANNYLLWFSVFIIIFIILFEILLNYNKYIILFEIIILSLLLHALFIPVTGLLGSDAQYDFYLIKLINQYGWSLQLDSSLVSWPAMHILFNISSGITGISLFDIARYFPSIISVMALLFMFCLSKHIHKQDYISLIYILLFSVVYYFIFLHSLPVRESFAFIILFAALYNYIVGKMRNNYIMKGLAIFLGLFLIISHHFTVFIFALFLLILYILYQALKIFENSVKDSSLFSSYSINYSLMIFIASIVYWIFVNIVVLKTLILSIQNLLSFGEAIIPLSSSLIYQPLVDIRTQIFMFSRIITLITTILIISLSYIISKKRFNFFESASLLFVTFVFIEWFITSFGFVKMVIYPERFELFAWAFLLIVLSPILYNNFTKNSNLFHKIITIIFLVSFLSMNISQIRPDLYDPSKEPPYENGIIRSSFLLQEYSAVDWFKGSGLIQSDRVIDDLLIHGLKGKIRTDPELFSGNMLKIQKNDWLIIRKEMFKRILGTRGDTNLIKKPLNLSIDTYNKINNFKIIKKIYSNGEVDIYSIINSNGKV